MRGRQTGAPLLRLLPTPVSGKDSGGGQAHTAAEAGLDGFLPLQQRLIKYFTDDKLFTVQIAGSLYFAANAAILALSSAPDASAARARAYQGALLALIIKYWCVVLGRMRRTLVPGLAREPGKFGLFRARARALARDPAVQTSLFCALALTRQPPLSAALAPLALREGAYLFLVAREVVSIAAPRALPALGALVRWPAAVLVAKGDVRAWRAMGEGAQLVEVGRRVSQACFKLEVAALGAALLRDYPRAMKADNKLAAAAAFALYIGAYAQLLSVRHAQLGGDVRVLSGLKLGGVGLGWLELVVDSALYARMLGLPRWTAFLMAVFQYARMLGPPRWTAFLMAVFQVDADSKQAVVVAGAARALYALMLGLPLWTAFLMAVFQVMTPERVGAFTAELRASDSPLRTLAAKALRGLAGGSREGGGDDDEGEGKGEKEGWRGGWSRMRRGLKGQRLWSAWANMLENALEWVLEQIHAIHGALQSAAGPHLQHLQGLLYGACSFFRGESCSGSEIWAHLACCMGRHIEERSSSSGAPQHEPAAAIAAGENKAHEGDESIAPTLSSSAATEDTESDSGNEAVEPLLPPGSAAAAAAAVAAAAAAAALRRAAADAKVAAAAAAAAAEAHGGGGAQLEASAVLSKGAVLSAEAGLPAAAAALGTRAAGSAEATAAAAAAAADVRSSNGEQGDKGEGGGVVADAQDALHHRESAPALVAPSNDEILGLALLRASAAHAPKRRSFLDLGVRPAAAAISSAHHHHASYSSPSAAADFEPIDETAVLQPAAAAATQLPGGAARRSFLDVGHRSGSGGGSGGVHALFAPPPRRRTSGASSAADSADSEAAAAAAVLTPRSDASSTSLLFAQQQGARASFFDAHRLPPPLSTAAAFGLSPTRSSRASSMAASDLGDAAAAAAAEGGRRSFYDVRASMVTGVGMYGGIGGMGGRHSRAPSVAPSEAETALTAAAAAAAAEDTVLQSCRSGGGDTSESEGAGLSGSDTEGSMKEFD
ncbi:hypothetical protein JKP88DRAFT_347112 [Tribonema minus]|uniref:Uncharacterized protein n=1 Tax=Tribonema minus TaxID=303371 RepID=A0A835YJH6_9STRA|nr:hypothetical protein JKP88DRAFT_347112 [Tribonema minus]